MDGGSSKTTNIALYGVPVRRSGVSFPPITPPSSPITLSAWLFITMPIPSSGVVCVCVCLHLSARKLCSATVRTRAWQHLIKFTVWFDRRIFLTDWKSDQSVKKKNCQKCVCIFLCLVVFEEERDTLNRKTVLDF